MRITLPIKNLEKNNAEQCERLALAVEGVMKADTWAGRVECEVRDASVMSVLVKSLIEAGFIVQEPSLPERSVAKPDGSVAKVCIDGMTCRSCEITIERKVKKLPWVKQVDVDASHGTARIVCREGCPLDMESLKQVLHGEKYIVRGVQEKKMVTRLEVDAAKRPGFFQLVGLFALVLLVVSLFDRLGIFGAQASVSGTMTFAAALVLGLVAGSSSCLAVSGGLLLSSAGKFRERYGQGSFPQRMKPVFLFVTGRVLSYGILGGVIGLVGTAFTFSPFMTGALTVLAASYMLVMGLEMLHIAPRWMKSIMPRMPKALSHRIVDAEGNEHWGTPFLLGAATFFLPCGFTQSLQVYALTTGSFWSSALILAGFALGTAPALLALGWASGSLKGKAGKFFFQFSGALVVVLGLFNMQNGLTVAGYPLSFPSIKPSAVIASVSDEKITDDPNVVVEDGIQVIRMKVISSSPYYYPTNVFTVNAGQSVRMEIDGKAAGCRSLFMIPKLGVSEYLDQPQTVLNFTPQQPGSYSFSCSMGMYRGTLNVI